jgi:hypothetical protein
MSVDKNYYVIAGYDLTSLKTEKYKDWKWTDDGEQFLCNQVSGNVQLFDDPMHNAYLYLGHVLAAGDEWSFNTVKFDIVDINNCFEDVTLALYRLQCEGIVSSDLRNTPVFQVIVFEECR